MNKLIRTLALLALPFFAQAQRHHEIGLMAGVSNYHGDLQGKWYPSNGYKPMGGIIYKYFLSPRFGVRFGASYSQLTAADSLSDVAVKRQRNLSFTSSLFELQGGFEFNFLPIEVDRMKVTPYVFGGLGVFYTNPYTQAVNGDKVYLRPLSTEGQGLGQYPDRKQYNHINVSFPFGGGLKFFVGNTLMITTEVGFRYTSTDYIDDVSTSYVNMDTLKAARGQQAVDLSFRGTEVSNWDGNYPNYKYQRGDSKANDWYIFGGINIAIYFRAFGNIKDYLQTRCPGSGRYRSYKN